METTALRTGAGTWFLASTVIYMFRSADLPMGFIHFLQCSMMMVMTFLGGYRLYYWVAQGQIRRRLERGVHAKEFFFHETVVDQWLGFSASWVYVYSLMFYGLFGLILLGVRSQADMFGVLARGLTLAIAHLVFWLFVPTTVPQSLIFLKEKHRQTAEPPSIAVVLLRLVQTYDGQNCESIPSMHCSLACFLSLVLYFEQNRTHPITLCIPLLVAISCIKTKQHVFWDCVTGIVVALAMYPLLN